MNILRRTGVLLSLAGLIAFCGTASAAESNLQLNIAPQSLGAALNEFARQSGLQVFLSAEEGTGITTKKVSGTYSPKAALDMLLAGTGLAYEFLNDRTIAVRQKGQPADPARRDKAWLLTGGEMRLVQVTPQAQTVKPPTAPSEAAPAQDDGTDSKGIPEMLVKGARGASTDIRRTNDDVQPYMVFDSEDLENSMAASVDDFLRERLPMNQSLTRTDDGGSFLNAEGNRSQIDLRGLGTDETLILVNGRRMPGVANDSSGLRTSQADINGIPLSAIERIEVLPSTAGGIYGGGATGGVVNIVLKRDYSNMAVTARYDGTVEGGGAERRLDGAAGFSVGNTNVMIMGSIRDGKPLYAGDRDFARRSRELAYRNNPAAFESAVIFGHTTNIRNTVLDPATGRPANLVLRNGAVPLGSGIAQVAVGSRGYALDGAFAFQPGYNRDLADATLGNEYSLLTVPQVRSLQLNLRHEFSERISAFLDAGRFENQSVRMGTTNLSSTANTVIPALVGGLPNPANPFTTNIQIAVPMVGYDSERLEMPVDSMLDTLGAGVTVRLMGDWLAAAEYTFSISEFDATLETRAALSAAGIAALGNGTLDPFRDVNLYPLNFSAYYPEMGSAASGYYNLHFPVESEVGTLRVAGPLMSLPGGSLHFSGLVERREEYTGERLIATFLGPTIGYIYYGPVGYNVDSAYAELNVPLFSQANARKGVRSLELLASYRYDDRAVRAIQYGQGAVLVPSPEGPFPDFNYVERSNVANQYTLGFRYAPVESVALRASFGRGVLPPAPAQLSINDISASLTFGQIHPTVRDAARGNTLVASQLPAVRVLTNNGNLSLRPELSDSLSVGLIFNPAVLPGLRLSVDYTRIEKTDEITTIAAQALLDEEDLFPGSVVRNPLTAADQLLGYTRGTIDEFNYGPVNIAKMKMEAFDVQATYDWSTRFGSFAATLAGTVQPVLLRQSTLASQELESVGYDNGPMKMRANAGLRWSRGNVDLGWNIQYLDSYRPYSGTSSAVARAAAILLQGSPIIPSQTYHDVSARYSFGATQGFAGGVLSNTELRLGVQNVFNTLPPTLASTAPSGIAGTARGSNLRLQRYSISIKKEF